MLTLSLFIVCYFVQFCVYTSLYYICARHCIASRYRGINYTFDFDFDMNGTDIRMFINAGLDARGLQSKLLITSLSE